MRTSSDEGDSKSLQSVITLLCYCRVLNETKIQLLHHPWTTRNNKARPQGRLPIPLPGEVFSFVLGREGIF